ncbi:MAG TPA: TraB/GumN family protein [Steroidobacteraceae bacterium]|jgi:hypothetical protein
MRLTQIFLLIALLRVGTNVANEVPMRAAPPRIPSERGVQEVLISSDHAGPALWKVTSGPHLLWILAAPPTPLPADFDWRTNEVEAALAGAQEVILDGGITFNSIKSAIPLSATAYQDMRMIPGQQNSLQDVVSADLYRRFETLKDALAANYDSMEQLRPWAAGFELRRHVMKTLRLSDTTVSEAVVRFGWRATVITLYTYADYAVFERNSKSGQTVSCLEEIVAELETDRDDWHRLGHAWAVGDLETLRQVVRKPDACVLDLFDNDAQAQDATAHHTAQWLAAAEAALKTRNSTFALVPTDEIFAPDGWLAALRAAGYDVQEPH